MPSARDNAALLEAEGELSFYAGKFLIAARK